MAGVQWTGADGNRYIKDGSGTRNLGAATTQGQEYWQNQGYNVILDPVNGGGAYWYDESTQSLMNQDGTYVNNGGSFLNGTSTTAPSGGGAGGTSYAPLNQAGIDNTTKTLNELPGLLQAALEAENQNYLNTKSDFDTQEGTQKKTYDGSTVTNQQNYDATFMDSIRAGIKGLAGLKNFLRGTGAAGGTAEDQVRDVVGGVTSNDIRGGADTQKANQGALDNALSVFLTNLQGKRQVADDTFENNKRAITRDNQSQMQDLYGKMANFYGEAGRMAEANDFMGRAGALTPSIASNSKTQVSAYDRTPVAVEAPQLTAFAAPSQPQVAVAPQDGQVGSGIFTMTRRKELPTSATPLPLGA